MKAVIRRILPLVFTVLIVAGCGATERDALSVGSQSISADGLTDLVLSVNGGPPDGELPQTLSAQSYREIGAVWLRDAAAVSYLDSTGVRISEAESEAIKIQIEDAIAGNQIGVISRQSEGYDALTNNIWISSSPGDLGSPEAQQALLQLVREADVESRIGVWDSTELLIVPRG